MRCYRSCSSSGRGLTGRVASPAGLPPDVSRLGAGGVCVGFACRISRARAISGGAFGGAFGAREMGPRRRRSGNVRSLRLEFVDQAESPLVATPCRSRRAGAASAARSACAPTDALAFEDPLRCSPLERLRVRARAARPLPNVHLVNHPVVFLPKIHETLSILCVSAEYRECNDCRVGVVRELRPSDAGHADPGISVFVDRPERIDLLAVQPDGAGRARCRTCRGTCGRAHALRSHALAGGASVGAPAEAREAMLRASEARGWRRRRISERVPPPACGRWPFLGFVSGMLVPRSSDDV